ncbi:MAG TPA: hypothetical protein VG057_16425, partial [Solirubrobacteraceae bacterium]|nr:hypothetical protein [Solirubrobacteraceae bacterium]
MRWTFPRRPGRAQPTAGEGGERTDPEGLVGDSVATGSAPATKPGLTEPRVSPPPVVVPRWVQLVVLPLAVLGLW